MIRYTVVAALLGGVFRALYMPRGVAGHVTGYTIVASLTPPTLATGGFANLNCGWHGQCTTPPTSGTALDWEEGADNAWYFRGFFATNRPGGGVVAKGAPLVNQAGSDRCDIMTVWIIEAHHNVLRAAPTYTHVDLSNPAQFSITGSPLGTYLSREIGDAINDVGCPAFFGDHVHDDHVSTGGIAQISRNTGLYPTAAQCSDACGVFQNNSPTRWICRFTWAESG